MATAKPGRTIGKVPRKRPLAVTIRRATPDDVESFVETFSDPSAYSGTLQLPYPSVEFWRKRLAAHSDETYVLVAEHRGKVVGNIGLHPGAGIRRRHSADIGMSVHAKFQAQGVGTQLMAAALDLADNWFNFKRVQLTVFVDNAPAIALYKRFGFEIEGTHRKFAFRNGAYVDAFFMARLRD